MIIFYICRILSYNNSLSECIFVSKIHNLEYVKIIDKNAKVKKAIIYMTYIILLINNLKMKSFFLLNCFHHSIIISVLSVK